MTTWTKPEQSVNMKILLVNLVLVNMLYRNPKADVFYLDIFQAGPEKVGIVICKKIAISLNDEDRCIVNPFIWINSMIKFFTNKSRLNYTFQ